MPETYEVMHFIRNNILKKLLRLVAMILEVPEEAVLSTHAPGGSKTEYIRYVSFESPGHPGPDLTDFSDDVRASLKGRKREIP